MNHKTFGRAVGLALIALAAASSTTAQTEVPKEGFLCCNLRTDGSWISDINYAESGKTVVPAGTPVNFLGFGRYRVQVELDGKKQAIGNDYSRELSMEAFAKRYIVEKDPKPRIAAAPAKIRTAIESARVAIGMTREQVAMAVGHAVTSENPHADAQVLRFWLWSFSPFSVHFDKNDRVEKVEADAETLTKVFLK